MSAIKQARLLAGLSHRKAAEAMQIDKTTIALYEREGRTNFSTEILTRMADLYGCTVDQLLGRQPLPEAADVGA